MKLDSLLLFLQKNQSMSRKKSLVSKIKSLTKMNKFSTVKMTTAEVVCKTNYLKTVAFTLKLRLGLPDVFCKNTRHFASSDRCWLCPKRLCNGTGVSNSIFLKERFFENAIIFYVIFFSIS